MLIIQKKKIKYKRKNFLNFTKEKCRKGKFTKEKKINYKRKVGDENILTKGEKKSHLN